MSHGLLWLFGSTLLPAGLALVQPAARSVWDGVYTEVQATRGERSYRRACANCHGPSLGGTESGPALTGDRFLEPWYDRTVAALADTTRRTMPKDDPGSLSTRQTADVLAYLLRANGYPAGPSDLPSTPTALADIRIEPGRP